MPTMAIPRTTSRLRSRRPERTGVAAGARRSVAVTAGPYPSDRKSHAQLSDLCEPIPGNADRRTRVYNGTMPSFRELLAQTKGRIHEVDTAQAEQAIAQPGVVVL